jgi:PAS domain S-box-containing protein
MGKKGTFCPGWGTNLLLGTLLGGAVLQLKNSFSMTDDKQIHEALRECEGKFLELFRENPLALTLSYAKDHRYIDVNYAFEQITGWTRDEVIGRSPFDIGLYVNPSERSELVKQLLSGATIRNREIRAHMKSGEIRTGFGFRGID